MTISIITHIQLGMDILYECFRNSVNEKHQSVNTFSTRWNVTTAQIILKDKDDMDALYPTK